MLPELKMKKKLKIQNISKNYNSSSKYYNSTGNNKKIHLILTRLDVKPS